MVGAEMCYALPVAYTLIKRITRINSQDWILPFGPITILNISYSPNYEISWMYQTTFYISTVVKQMTIKSFDLFYSFVMFQDCQLHEESSYTQGDKIDVSQIAWKYLESELNSIVRYHLSIIEIATDVEDIFSYGMLSVYLFTLGILCFEVYRAAVVSSTVIL
ncbi:hypothetical protein ILUMI_02614 [Ignelater luminosus]|uniref:Uncharacterized protein n=1 Tax=Ignelater luminosus TaxID=2038154 RepID=A0A8K0DHY4_IGNLU|nr:hypothetical protein ILUMI_02614 [Ignelater luminosus]